MLEREKMKIFIFAFLCANSINARTIDTKPISLEGKVIGGRHILRMGERPYMVSLRKDNSQFGIATLISKKNALTAGTIVLPYLSATHNYTSITLVGGTLLYMGSGCNPQQVVYIGVPDEFRNNPNLTSPYNIALVGVLKSIALQDQNRIKAVIPSPGPHSFGYGFLVGWGHDLNVPGLTYVQYPLQLKETPLDILGFTACKEFFEAEDINFHPFQMCAKPKPTLGNVALGNAAPGDLGDPFLIGHTIEGIYVFRNYNNFESPALFTKVNDHLTFITEARKIANQIRNLITE